jgi:Tfp pilus assembly protein PilO
MWSQFIAKIREPLWLKENKKTLLPVAAVFAGLIGLDLLLYGLLIAPTAGQLKAAEARYVELRRNHAEGVLFEKQKSAFAGMMTGIPTQKDMPLLVKELAQTARQQRLSVGTIKYDMPKRGSNELAMLLLSFPIEGAYPDIKRFIYEVETSGRFVGIQGLKLGAEQGRVKLDIKLVTYVKG